MGLDAVELVMAVETAFQLVLADAEVANCATVGQLAELVYSRLRHDSEDGCPGQRAFHLVRQQLLRQGYPSWREIRPTTPLAEIFPVTGRRENWRQLITALTGELSFAQRLIRPKWLGRGLFPALTGSGFAWGLWLGLPVALAAGAALLFSLVLVVGSSGYRTQFPAGMVQVRDLLRLVTTLESKRWSREAVYMEIRKITARQLGIDAALITAESRFVDDLGMG